MSYSFPPQVQVLVQKHMDTGKYASEDELLGQALQALTEDEEDLQAVRAAIAELKDGDAGTPLDEVFATLKQQSHAPKCTSSSALGGPRLEQTSAIAEQKKGYIMNVSEAEKNFVKLVNRVYTEGISVDLERDDKVIARLAPAELRSPLTVGELNAFLRSLPSLGDDADDFAEDVRAIRAEFPAEANPWD